MIKVELSCATRVLRHGLRGLHGIGARVLSVVLSMVLAAALAGCGGPKESALPAGTRVLALGDSLTFGYGVAPPQAWPVLLAGRTGWSVVNAGINGDTTAGALARLPALLEEHTPALVLVTLGGNDMLRKVPESQTVENLNRILDLVQARGARAVLIATPRPSLAGAVLQNLSPAPFYAALAKARGVPLVEDAIAQVLSDPQLKLDPLHPNPAGLVKLEEKIHKALKKIGYAR